MHYKSIAQLHKFFELEKEGKLPKGTAMKWVRETDIKKLPQHKKNGR